MLGTEPQIITDYVQTGRVKLVFWPVLNHGNPSLYSTATAECVAQQSTDAFWQIHHQLFTNQADLWSADRDYYVNAARSVGVDQATFETCYDSGAGVAYVMDLDAVRRNRGIFNQPVFDLNGQLFYGAQSYDTFAAAINSYLP